MDTSARGGGLSIGIQWQLIITSFTGDSETRTACPYDGIVRLVYVERQSTFHCVTAAVI